MSERKVAKRATLFIAMYLGAPVQADVPSEIYVCAGNISVGGGAMLMTGTHGAAFCDGKERRLIFNEA